MEGEEGEKKHTDKRDSIKRVFLDERSVPNLAKIIILPLVRGLLEIVCESGCSAWGVARHMSKVSQ